MYNEVSLYYLHLLEMLLENELKFLVDPLASNTTNIARLYG